MASNHVAGGSFSNYLAGLSVAGIGAILGAPASFGVDSSSVAADAVVDARWNQSFNASDSVDGNWILGHGDQVIIATGSDNGGGLNGGSIP